MTKRFPFRLTQSGVDELAQLLYTHQTVVNTLSRERSSCDRAYLFLSDLRRQCCDHSGALDPFPDLPTADDGFGGSIKRQRRQK